ncbi:Protein of unknown function [Mycobacterium canettii CIPT 140070010]|nr:Protein of unknown function [Mycobacterium canettii CIPT 140070010]
MLTGRRLDDQPSPIGPLPVEDSLIDSH